jgi:hypothetical protein
MTLQSPSIQAQLSVQPFTFNTGSLLLSITVDINCNSVSQAVSNVKPTDLLGKPCMSSFMHLQSAHLVAWAGPAEGSGGHRVALFCAAATDGGQGENPLGFVPWTDDGGAPASSPSWRRRL